MTISVAEAIARENKEGLLQSFTTADAAGWAGVSLENAQRCLDGLVGQEDPGFTGENGFYRFDRPAHSSGNDSVLDGYILDKG